MRLRDKVVLIGGAGSNMSRASALLFAQEGAKVALAARTNEKMHETAQRIRADGGDVLTHQTDLTETSQVDSLIDATISEFGRIDCFIHAAGGFFSTEHDITAMDPEFWDGALENNLRTLFNPVRKLVPILQIVGVAASSPFQQEQEYVKMQTLLMLQQKQVWLLLPKTLQKNCTKRISASMHYVQG